MDGCSQFLVILSHASLQSEWVLEEIKLARARFDRDPSFVVLQLITGNLSRPLPDLQQVPYLGEFVDQLKAVLKAVGLEPRGLEARKLPLSLPEAAPRRPEALDTARAWDRAAKGAQSAALLRRTGRLKQLLEKDMGANAERVSVLSELRQLRQEHAIVS
jgi:hypothetical protein